MRPTKILSFIFLLSVTSVCHSANLGKINVQSNLGQPLLAEIEVATLKEAPPSVTARLASREDFKRAGLEYSPELQHVRVTLDSLDNELSIIKLTSVKPINNPFQSLLIELTWPSGKQLREYSFLLEELPHPTQSQIKGTNSLSESLTTEPTPAEITTQATPLPLDSSELKSRVVKSGETLYRIALEHTSRTMQIEHVMASIYRQNPSAFLGKNMNRLMAGVVLTIPPLGKSDQISLDEAKKIIRLQQEEWRLFKSNLAERSTTKNEQDQTLISGGKITPYTEDKPDSPSIHKNLLKLSSGKPDDARGAGDTNMESQISDERAAREVATRIAMLEKNLELLTTSMALKESETKSPPLDNEKTLQHNTALSSAPSHIPSIETNIQKSQTPSSEKIPAPVETDQALLAWIGGIAGIILATIGALGYLRAYRKQKTWSESN